MTQRQRRARDGQAPIDWIVMRNRLGHVDARNKRAMTGLLTQLAKRVGFRLVPGFGERVIFRELFLKGLTLLDMREEPTTHMRFDADGAALGLSESIALKTPSLCFKCPDRHGLMGVLEQHNMDFEKFPGFEGAFVEIKAPEGTIIYAFEEDFLGESYEVDETGHFDEFPG